LSRIKERRIIIKMNKAKNFGVLKTGQKMRALFVMWAQQLDSNGMQQDIPFVPVKYQG
jgi:hypothetical protein